MPIQFQCPECQRSVRVSDALAGLHSRCPECGANVPVPETSSGAIAPRPRPEAPPVGSGGGGGGGWESRRPEYGRPPEYDRPSDYGRASDYGRPSDYGRLGRAAAEPGWDTTRHGLTMEFVAAIIILCAYIGMVLLQCVMVGFIGGGMGMGPRGGEGLMMLLAGLSIVALISVLVAVVLMIVARCMCCTAPRSSGLKGLAVGATICFLAALLLVGLFVLLAALGASRPFRGGPDELLLLAMVVLILAALVGVVAHILFLVFLRGVAVTFGNHSLGTRCIVYLVFSIIVPLLMVGGQFLLAPVLMRAGDPRGVLIFVFIVQTVVALVMLGWYCSLIAQVRDTVAQRRRVVQDDWGD